MEALLLQGTAPLCLASFFNRLGELKSGSLVKLETEDRQMMFKVFDKKIVAPEEVNVLQAQRGKLLLSLVTCHLQHSSKYRLVIQAKRIQ
ncbi:sortase [Pseudobacillus sp. FSL P4-0506]|uniref:sortase n=1 Tax=unclassified Pseudobacillus TaxID=2619284 RepID=UPI0030F83BA9